MLIQELIGKTITSFYAISRVEQEWLDTADCIMELDNNLLIGFPYASSQEVWIRKVEPGAENLFNNTSKYVDENYLILSNFLLAKNVLVFVKKIVKLFINEKVSVD